MPGPTPSTSSGGLRQVYRNATATFRVAPAVSMSWLSPVQDMGMVVNQVKDRGDELRQFLGLKKSDKLVYLYVGRYGQSDLDWPRLAEQATRGVHFVTYPPCPPARQQTCMRFRLPTGRAAT